MTTTTHPQRADYMNGIVTFSEFYGSVAKAAGVSLKGNPKLIARVKAALANGDEHLNTIPLSEWDILAAGAAPQIAASLKLHGDSYSLAGGVCVMKEAARRVAETVV